jgi:hypothetical protein
MLSRMWTRPVFLMTVVLFAWAAGGAAVSPIQSNAYFGIQVVDEQTGRGVPMVELKTTSGTCYYTDSGGWVAFYEPGLMSRKVWFGVSSHGYVFPADAFGSRGVALQTEPGKTARLKIKRLNIAERLYRITGQGIYRDTVLLGQQAPIAEPLLNAEVTGQDGILTASYRGKLYWFYGDTCRAAYALGNFSMTGATTEPAEKLDPAVGLNLKYFTGTNGFARAMAPLQGQGVVWLFGLVVIPDAHGQPRMLAWYQRRQGMGEVFETGIMVYNDDKEQFERFKTLPLQPRLTPTGYPFRAHDRNGAEYVYFTTPYPALRVKADWNAYQDPSSYESYTCLKPGTGDDAKGSVELDRDAKGKLVWAWKKDTAPLNPKTQQDLIKAGKMSREESPFRLQDAESGKPVLLNNCSCFWNDYRQKYVMIASEAMGATMLGEVWYSEAPQPEGPWVRARKIITHANKAGDAHDFYNPTQHPFFDQAGGRVIYLEGSYVNTFSGNPHTTPYYEYNQIMYRLDLADPRLKLAAP